MQTLRAERSSINSLSSPAVGKYTAIWMVFGRLGGLSTMGRKDDDDTKWLDMYGSRSLLHITMVPPKQREVLNAKSQSCKSAEFSEEKYSPWNSFI